MAPKAPIGARRTTMPMIPKNTWAIPSSTPAVLTPNGPILVQAKPVRMAITSTCSRSPSAKALKKVLGIRCSR